MSDNERNDDENTPSKLFDHSAPPRRRRRRRRSKPVRIKRARIIVLILGIGTLACVSFCFGVMMAVTSNLPRLEEPATKNSRIVDRRGRDLGILTGSENRLLLAEEKIAPVMKQAAIAIEDSRFYGHNGVDLRGVGRALWQDVIHQRAVQGASTIPQQFVKNALAAQNERTLFAKLREAVLAYRISRDWSKERVLRDYLNTIYFGNGAYGIEAAAETYFGKKHLGCESDKDRPCAARLEPHEAALLAGMVASPSGYDPVNNPQVSEKRRNLVLERMVEQGFLSDAQYAIAIKEPIPTRYDLTPPHNNTRFPYFTAWLQQQIVDKLGGGQRGARLAFTGGLKIKTTLDSDFQLAAEEAIRHWLPNPLGPQASIVVLDNKTAEVLAMVGGLDYNTRPFNLATQSRRQPGSAFKPFVLAEALSEGISENSKWPSKKLELKVPNSTEVFTVKNDHNAYSGVSSLATATTYSDNSVFAQVGIKVGTKKVADLARRMGIRTPVSSNYSITLGGLRTGLTPVDLAHAYETVAQGGNFTYGTLSSGNADYDPPQPVPGPVGIREILRPTGHGKFQRITVNKTRTHRVLEPAVARKMAYLLHSVVTKGTATRAQPSNGQFAAGKTGTTEDNADAWFVGWTQDTYKAGRLKTRGVTIAVWVGHPEEMKSMKYAFNGKPVEGGTYPALIFRRLVDAMTQIEEQRARGQEAKSQFNRQTRPSDASSTETSPSDDTSSPSSAPAPSGTPTPSPSPSSRQQQQDLPPTRQRKAPARSTRRREDLSGQTGTRPSRSSSSAPPHSSPPSRDGAEGAATAPRD